MLLELLDGFAPVGRLANEFYIRLGLNQVGDAVTDNRVIVCHKNSDHNLTPPFHRNNVKGNRFCRVLYTTEPGTLTSTSVPVSGPLRITSLEPI